MNEQQQSLEDLQHIKKMMERSSRFISLSGLSGISAGFCALLGVWIAKPYVMGHKEIVINEEVAILQAMANDYSIILNTYLFWIAVVTFLGAFTSAFIFTFFKTKKEGTLIWSASSKRLMINLSIPIIVGGIFLFRMLQFETFGLVAPGCLIFYGLGLVNASKYTLIEIRYLGYIQIILGLVNLWFVGFGLYFWAVGFGMMHILYGAYMWNKYERK